MKKVVFFLFFFSINVKAGISFSKGAQSVYIEELKGEIENGVILKQSQYADMKKYLKTDDGQLYAKQNRDKYIHYEKGYNLQSRRVESFLSH